MSNRTICTRIPPPINSLGLLSEKEHLIYFLPALELQIVTIYTITQVLHYLLKPFRFPRFLSEILVGIMLGPSMPNSVQRYTYKLFPLPSQTTVVTLSTFGYTLLLFLIGAKTDVSLMKKTGRKAIAIGVLALMVPILVGTTVTFIITASVPKLNLTSMLAVVATHSLSPFPNISLLLRDLKILNSELGRLALSSAIITEGINVVLVSIMNFVMVYQQYGSSRRVITNACLSVSFLLFAIFLVRPAMVWVVKQTPEGRPVKSLYVNAIILFMFVCCVFTQFIEQLPLFGAFVIGLAVPDGPPLGSTLVDRLESFSSGLLVPIFVTIVSSRINLRTILTGPDPLVFGLVVVVLLVAKVVACFLPARLCKMPTSDALALGFIMSTKGVVEISSYSIIRDHEAITEQILSVMVVTIAWSAVFVPLFVRKLYDPSRKYAGYQRRNILHSRPESELKIVACIHMPNNIDGIISLLDASGPTKVTPITVLALHLVELRGRASPIFISHQLQKKTVSNLSYSEDVIIAFNQCERENRGSILSQIFTAISPRKLMHEDICNLALDKLAALIIIPFHRKWDVHGFVESEDNGLRALNSKILDIAPCSVGILVDRGLLGRKSSYSVAMIFLGGNDDREALAYAKRIARSSRISLTVIRCVATEHFENLDKNEGILDKIVLEDVKHNNIGSEFVFYVEETTNEGAETVTMIRSVVDEYDLIIVGRRNNEVRSPHTSGLEEWSEFRELGIIGDVLASSDCKTKASVLVIQQQQHMIH